jgi:hypothetical protein
VRYQHIHDIVLGVAGGVVLGGVVLGGVVPGGVVLGGVVLGGVVDDSVGHQNVVVDPSHVQ